MIPQQGLMLRRLGGISRVASGTTQVTSDPAPPGTRAALLGPVIGTSPCVAIGPAPVVDTATDVILPSGALRVILACSPGERVAWAPRSGDANSQLSVAFMG